jgi:hypothetical protein
MGETRYPLLPKLNEGVFTKYNIGYTPIQAIDIGTHNAVWRIDSLLGKDLETNSETTTVAINGAVNMPLQQYSYCWKRCFLLDPCKGIIRKTIGATQY